MVKNRGKYRAPQTKIFKDVDLFMVKNRGKYMAPQAKIFEGGVIPYIWLSMYTIFAHRLRPTQLGCIFRIHSHF